VPSECIAAAKMLHLHHHHHFYKEITTPVPYFIVVDYFLYILLTYSLILIILRIFLRRFWFAIYQNLDGSMSVERTMQFWCVGARIMSHLSRFCPSIDDAIRTRIFRFISFPPFVFPFFISIFLNVSLLNLPCL